MDIKEVRANAKERMKGFCRVCPVCDGAPAQAKRPVWAASEPGARSRTMWLRLPASV